MAGKRQRTIAFVISQVMMVLMAIVLASTSGAAAPTGNSGTVKVDGIAFEDHHANEPHPSCDFRITFWGYGEGREATATFAMQSPTNATTGPGSTTYGPIDIGTDPAGGGNDPDGNIVVNLGEFLEDSGATAHPQQGFHVKLTVNATGSQGADVKHKVFWVECVTEVLGTRTTRRTDGDAEVLGKTVLGKGLARTGLPLGMLALIATELFVLGMAMLRSSRRRELVRSEITQS